jgi:hypothetical protein
MASAGISAAHYLANNRRVRVDLSNGTTFIFPVDEVQGLRDVPDDKLAQIEVWSADTLAWPALDTHVPVLSLMSGVFGSKGWLAELQRARGKKGGNVPFAGQSRCRERQRQAGRSAT